MTSPLVRYEILGLFVNTLMADHMCSWHSSEKFLQQVQKQLSSKAKASSQTFFAFLKYT